MAVGSRLSWVAAQCTDAAHCVPPRLLRYNRDSGGWVRSIAANQAVLRRVIEEIWNQHQADAIATLITDSFVTHVGTEPPGIDGVRYWQSELHRACPDGQLDSDSRRGEDDQVVTHWTLRATTTGAHVLPDGTRGPPTGKSLPIAGVTITWVANGTLVDDGQSVDTADWLRHLGVLSAPEQGQQVNA